LKQHEFTIIVRRAVPLRRLWRLFGNNWKCLRNGARWRHSCNGRL